MWVGGQDLNPQIIKSQTSEIKEVWRAGDMKNQKKEKKEKVSKVPSSHRFSCPFQFCYRCSFHVRRLAHRVGLYFWLKVQFHFFLA